MVTTVLVRTTGTIAQVLDYRRLIPRRAIQMRRGAAHLTTFQLIFVAATVTILMFLFHRFVVQDVPVVDEEHAQPPIETGSTE